MTRAVFYGLGSDGTVGATKNSVKIIGENTPLYAQGYFVYDSKKAGSVTVSHLRFSPRPIDSTYLDRPGEFCGLPSISFSRADRRSARRRAGRDVLAQQSATDPTKFGISLPLEVQQQIIDKRLKFYVVDGYSVAQQAGMAGRFNTADANLLLRVGQRAAARTGDRKNQRVDSQNLRQARRIGAAEAIGPRSMVHSHRCTKWKCPPQQRRRIAACLPCRMRANGHDGFVKRVTAMLISGQGDRLPVSALPVDGTFPTEHRPIRKAQHRAGDSDLGQGTLHPVRPVRRWSVRTLRFA